MIELDMIKTCIIGFINGPYIVRGRKCTPTRDFSSLQIFDSSLKCSKSKSI